MRYRAGFGYIVGDKMGSVISAGRLAAESMWSHAKEKVVPAVLVEIPSADCDGECDSECVGNIDTFDEWGEWVRSGCRWDLEEHIPVAEDSTVSWRKPGPRCPAYQGDEIGIIAPKEGK